MGIALVHLSGNTMKLPTSLRLVSTYILPHTLSWWSIPSKHIDSFLSQSHYTFFLLVKTDHVLQTKYQSLGKCLMRFDTKYEGSKLANHQRYFISRKVQLCHEQLFLFSQRGVCIEKQITVYLSPVLLYRSYSHII